MATPIAALRFLHVTIQHETVLSRSCKILFCFQNNHLQSSILHDTTTAAVENLPRQPPEQTVNKVELKVIIPLFVGIIVILMVVLCIRYRLEQSVWFQSFLSTLKGTKLKDRPHLDPPPEYEVALDMPKPVANYNTPPESAHDATDSNSFASEPSSTRSQDVEKQTGDRDEKGRSLTETCQMIVVDEQRTTQNYLILATSEQGTEAPIERTSKNNTEQIFAISTASHLHKMTYSPASPPQYLPSYEEYMDQVPDGYL